MLYWLLEHIAPELAVDSLLRVLGYTTVRAAAALGSAFVLSLLIGPWIFHRLRMLKVGQQVRQFKTAETQQFNIHAHKQGTPTMGGILIVLATVISSVIFCSPDNSYVWLVLFVMVATGALGFMDDYLKVVKKNHKGVSARMKLVVQLSVGLVLGLVLLLSRPHTAYGNLLLSPHDIANPVVLSEKIAREDNAFTAYLSSELTASVQSDLQSLKSGAAPSPALEARLIRDINRILYGPSIYSKERFENIVLTQAAAERLEYESQREAVTLSTRLNRFLLESAFPDSIAKADLHRGDTNLLVPFFKDFYPALGIWFIFWAALVICAASNAVNLTDGLDGLAIGTVITVSVPYMLIAYLASRFDYASYLLIPHVPQAGELTILIAAMLGASMGFLWFNAHPAEVFMGDTGSLSLGAAIGAVALLTKHEILLILIGGIFVVEALSVVLQVGSYKLRGKRVFLMSPLHNHFVKKGVHESRIIFRFLIVATLLAMIGLSTLKLR
jgi:phospho-N-acetylmuramoyl-pentapeptide-transferase